MIKSLTTRIYFGILFCVCVQSLLVDSSVDWSEDRNPEKWNNLAKKTLENILNRKLNRNIAKNLIMFIGDGMGISTVTAGRIRKGQKLGKKLTAASVLQHYSIISYLP